MGIYWLLISAGAFVGTLIFREMFVWLRDFIPKSVQCWFCHHRTEVPYSLSNSWHCPKCEQYNGFSKDGDYNSPIQQQYDERLNFSVSAIGRRKGAFKQEKHLCRDCNKNQLLRVQQLASFEPLNPKNYDAEVEHFRDQIDKAYKLCNNCQLLLHSVLKKEREDFGLPRRLNSTVTHKAAKGTWLLCASIILALSLSLIGFIQTRLASSLKNSAAPAVLPFLKTRAPLVYSAVRSVSPTVIKSTAVDMADYVVLLGAILYLAAFYRSHRQAVALLFISLVWLALLGASLLCGSTVEYHLPVIQVLTGTTSLLVTFHVLTKIYTNIKEYQQRQQTILAPKVPKYLNCSAGHAPNGTSTPKGTTPESSKSVVDEEVKSYTSRGTPTQPQSFSYADSFVSFQTRGTARNPAKDVGLEPGIKGLTLGSGVRDADHRSMWNGHSVLSIPNTSSWTVYSAPASMLPRNAPVNSPSLTHIYTAGFGASLSRPTSPESTIKRSSSVMNTSFTEYNLRKRKSSQTVIAPASFR